jgi:hypothetical protein
VTYEPLDPYEPDADRYLRQVIDLLTEIRDRLPRSRIGTEPETGRRSAGDTDKFFRSPARIFGWAIDGSEGPPTLDQFLTAQAMAEDLKSHSWPMLAAESAALGLAIAAGQLAYPESAK